MKQIVIYTDGACSCNPGPGGWGAVLIFGNIEKQISGFENNTTNNRMEMLKTTQPSLYNSVIRQLIKLK